MIHGGRPAVLLRDPLRLTNKTIVVPQQLAPLLALCDGTRDASALSAALAVRFGVGVAPSTVEQLLDNLDDALLLDNERFSQAKEQALAEYRRAPFRPLANGAQSCPTDRDELRQSLQAWLDAADDVRSDSAAGRGLISPHIDFARGGAVYGRVWQRAAEMTQAAELVVVLGTDHYSEGNLLTLTRQHYATPFGILPTAQPIVDVVAQAIGPEAAFAGELHHCGEHSIELAAIWLHYIREERPCELVPILCGSFERFVGGEEDPLRAPALNACLDALRQTVAGRSVVVVAAADLSHVGPAFGGQPVGLVERARVQAADQELIERICAGDAQGFFDAIRRDGDRRNVCGLPPVYLALRLLQPVEGEQVAYERCPADERGTSFVSICGIVWR